MRRALECDEDEAKEDEEEEKEGPLSNLLNEIWWLIWTWIENVDIEGNQWILRYPYAVCKRWRLIAQQNCVEIYIPEAEILHDWIFERAPRMQKLYAYHADFHMRSVSAACFSAVSVTLRVLHIANFVDAFIRDIFNVRKTSPYSRMLTSLVNLVDLRCTGSYYLPRATDLRALSIRNNNVVAIDQLTCLSRLEKIYLGRVSNVCGALPTLPRLTSLGCYHLPNDELTRALPLLTNLCELSLDTQASAVTDHLSRLTSLVSLALVCLTGAVIGHEMNTDLTLALSRLTRLHVDSHRVPLIHLTQLTELRDLTLLTTPSVQLLGENHSRLTSLVNLASLDISDSFLLSRTVFDRLSHLTSLVARQINIGIQVKVDELHKRFTVFNNKPF